LSAVSRWRARKAEKKYQAVVLFDLSTAYDLLDIRLFLRKADVLGFSVESINWLRSYLTDRRQLVQVNDAQSEPRNLDCGTPQGSVCSCLIFAIFVGDIEKWTGSSILQGFADDTFITVVGNSLEDVCKLAEIESEKVMNYFAINRMVTNPSKTGFLVIRPGKTQQNSANIKIANECTYVYLRFKKQKS